MGGGSSSSSATFTPSEEVTGQDNESVKVFEMLELNTDDINKLFKIFKKLDTSKVNRITIDSILKFIHVGKSKLSVRILRSADLDHDGRLNFKEFVLNAWTFAIKDVEGVCAYAFDNFDLDGSGELGTQELRDMVSDVHLCNSKSATELTTAKITEDVTKLLVVMDTGDKDKKITRNEFLAHCLEFQDLLFPALQTQIHFIDKVVGVEFWESKKQYAHRYVFHLLFICIMYSNLACNNFSHIAYDLYIFIVQDHG
jgi:Ca2+-binding EF-hand superfamily protein